jgi:hypothetical protein
MSIEFENEFARDIDDKEFGIWIANGIDRGWITPGFCYTHEGDPYMSDEEMEEWEDGGDPCCFVFKIKDR